MKSWKNALVAPGDTIRKAIGVIEDSALQVALVVDESGRLVGTVTDGDIRRAVLKDVPLGNPVTGIMFQRPTTAHVSESRERLLALMREKDIRHVPLLDDSGRLVGLETVMDLVRPRERTNVVVLMAGGLGSRLRPLTEDIPKPLVRVGEKPILEIILEKFRESGFRRFYLAVNYKAELIRDYFGDGSRHDVRIDYLAEKERMGTAGALGLLEERPGEPLFVMNSDLLTLVDFGRVLDFHQESGSFATMCVREYDFEVPFGVVRLEGERLVGLEEKPVQSFFVNAGIYVLDPEALSFIPGGRFFDMTDLFESLISAGKHTVCFPMREYWLDIGRALDLEKAEGDYHRLFKTKEKPGDQGPEQG